MDTTYPRGDVDWVKTKETITEIQNRSPGFTEDNSLIGGAASWFYKTLLEKTADKDFPAVIYSKEEESIWYSKDIDFIGTKRADLPKELHTLPEGDPPLVKINGIWIDSPDEGVFLTRDLARKTAIELQNSETKEVYRVTSACLLYREKKALGKLEKTISRPQDILHLRTLKQAAKLTICALLEEETLSRAKATLAFKLIKEAQEIAPELLQDSKLLARLEKQMFRLEANQDTKALYHLLKNQILKSENLKHPSETPKAPKSPEDVEEI